MLTLYGHHDKLNPVARAFSYQRLMELLDIGQTALANLVSVARSTVSTCVSFRTRLSAAIVDYCLSHKVNLGCTHIRELARLEWYPTEQVQHTRPKTMSIPGLTIRKTLQLRSALTFMI